MNSSFVLDINKYNLDELGQLFNLPTSFTTTDVINSEKCLRGRIVADADINSKKKKDILSFLDKIREKLFHHIKEKSPDHEIIKKNPSDIRYLNPIVRPRNGVENLDRSTTKLLVSIDSRFRDNYYDTLSTDFSIDLPTVVKNVVSMDLS